MPTKGGRTGRDGRDGAAQIAAEELALDPGQVTVMLGDTDFPRAGNSTGAITSASVGNAVQLAARNLRQRLIQLAVTDPHPEVRKQAGWALRIQLGEPRSFGNHHRSSAC